MGATETEDTAMTERNWGEGYGALIDEIDRAREAHIELWNIMIARMRSGAFGTSATDVDLERAVSAADEKVKRAEKASQDYSLEHLRSVGYHV